MKKFNFNISALALLVVLVISSCSVHNREYNRRPLKHNHHDDRRRDGNDNHYNRNF